AVYSRGRRRPGETSDCVRSSLRSGYSCIFLYHQACVSVMAVLHHSHACVRGVFRRQKHNQKHPQEPTHDKESGMERRDSFGYWMRRRRKTLDLTQNELARQVGCAVGTIQKLEGDERRPSKQLAARLADLLLIAS